MKWSGASILEGLIFSGLLSLVIFTPLAFGAIEAWSETIMHLGVASLVFLCLLRMILDGCLRIPNARLIGLFFLFIAFVVVQLLPLPIRHTSAALRSVFDVGPMSFLQPKFSTLSIYPYATKHALFLLASYLGIFFVAAYYFSLDSPAAGPNLSAPLGKDPRLFKFVGLLTSLSFAIAFFSIMQYYTSGGRIYWLREPPSGSFPFGPFVNRNNYAGYMELTIPLALGWALARGARLELAILYGFMAVIMMASLFLSQSLGGILSLFGQLACFVFLLNLTKARSVASLKNAFALGAVALIVITLALWLGAEPAVERVHALVEKGDAPSYHARVVVWRDTLRIAKDFLIAGTGLGTFPYIYPLYASAKDHRIWLEAHNDYLQILSETGLIGVGLLSLLAIFSVVRALRLIRREGDRTLRLIRVGALTGCLGLLFHSITDFNLQIPSNALLFSILAAITVLPDVRMKDEG